MTQGTNTVIKLPFADNSSAGHNRAGEYTAQEQHSLLMLDIEYKHTVEDYVRDLSLTYGIPESDSERIVDAAFIMARNNVHTFEKGVPVHEYLEKYIGETHQVYIKCSKDHENQNSAALQRQELNTAISSVTRALMGRGLSYEQSLQRIANFLKSLSEDEKIALVNGRAKQEDVDRYDRVLDIMSRPGPRVVVDNTKEEAAPNVLEAAR